MRYQRADDRQGLLGRKPLGRRGELAANRDLGLVGRQSGQLRGQCRRTLVSSPNRRTVQARIRVGMGKQLGGKRVVECAVGVHHPQRLGNRSRPAYKSQKPGEYGRVSACRQDPPRMARQGLVGRERDVNKPIARELRQRLGSSGIVRAMPAP